MKCTSKIQTHVVPLQGIIKNLICCCLLLNFLIGIKDGSAADSEGLPSDEVPVEEPPLYKTIEGAKTYIVQHQNKDGGWPLIPGGDSNVESTAFAIWALIDAGWGTGSEVIRTGVRYLRNTQWDNGSWNNNTAHTTFALVALAAAETDPEVRFKGLLWLKKAQNRSGGWGKKERSPDNILYTAAVLAGFRKLGFKQNFEPISKGADWLAKGINFDGGWVSSRMMMVDSGNIRAVEAIQKLQRLRLWHSPLEMIRSIPVELLSTI